MVAKCVCLPKIFGFFISVLFLGQQAFCLTRTLSNVSDAVRQVKNVPQPLSATKSALKQTPIEDVAQHWARRSREAAGVKPKTWAQVQEEAALLPRQYPLRGRASPKMTPAEKRLRNSLESARKHLENLKHRSSDPSLQPAQLEAIQSQVRLQENRIKALEERLQPKRIPDIDIEGRVSMTPRKMPKQRVASQPTSVPSRPQELLEPDAVRVIEPTMPTQRPFAQRSVRREAKERSPLMPELYEEDIDVMEAVALPAEAPWAQRKSAREPKEFAYAKPLDLRDSSVSFGDTSNIQTSPGQSYASDMDASYVELRQVPEVINPYLSSSYISPAGMEESIFMAETIPLFPEERRSYYAPDVLEKSYITPFAHQFEAVEGGMKNLNTGEMWPSRTVTERVRSTEEVPGVIGYPIIEVKRRIVQDPNTKQWFDLDTGEPSRVPFITRNGN